MSLAVQVLHRVNLMVLVPAILGLPLVVAVCRWTVRRIRRSRLVVPAPTVWPEKSEAKPQRAVWRPAGLRQAEAELTRAVLRQSEVSLALVGMDSNDSDSAAEEVRLLDLLDETILGEMAPCDLLSAYGPLERLLVLPSVSASGLRAGAAYLCVAAEQRLGRPVRVALATFPKDGRTLRHLLDELERDLARRRQGGPRLGIAQERSRTAPAGADLTRRL